MSTIEHTVAVDPDKLMQFVFRAVDEVGATLNAALVTVCQMSHGPVSGTVIVPVTLTPSIST